MHPIIRLEGEALALLEHDFRDVAYRSAHTPEAYREEAVLQGMRQLYLDVMHAHAALFQREEAPQRAADIMSRFIQMLEGGSYRKHRTVSYYAEQLCVTAKHLLMHGKLMAKEVAAKLNFDNVSHFSRYVSDHFEQPINHKQTP